MFWSSLKHHLPFVFIELNLLEVVGKVEIMESWFLRSSLNGYGVAPIKAISLEIGHEIVTIVEFF